MKFIALLLLLVASNYCCGQIQPFRFAFISDTHIGSPNGNAEEDLRRTVDDINQMPDVAFVVLTGDITELGTDKELKLAKEILDKLNVRYYIIPGNHDTGWSESGGLSFNKIFGSDKFYFIYNGMHFIGCASGPYVRMSDGHVPRDHINWLEKIISEIPAQDPIVFLNHYPLDKGLDNWYKVIDVLKHKNTVLALCGHGHANRLVEAEDISAVMGRSNLRAKAAAGGYNLVDVRNDSILFTERNPVTKNEKLWTNVEVKKHVYDPTKKFPRPDYSVNDTYSWVKPRWTFTSVANVISTPAVAGKLVVFGNQQGVVQALKIKNGKTAWSYITFGPIFSSPAFSRKKIVFGSADGSVYCINTKGKKLWSFKTNAAVLGSPLIHDDVVYIGGSDSCFQAISLKSGVPLWRSCILEGPVVSTPVIYKNRVVFGAWDRNLYALDKEKGNVLWKWNNGSSVINFSPAACIPVVHNDVIYVVAPDRYLSAIDATSGKTLWRTNASTVRESIGISEDGKLVYGKTMNDTIVAFFTNKQEPKAAWKLNAGFGYEHVPSMLIEKEKVVYFGTKNGVVYAIDPNTPKVIWAHKIDNSMVNTVNPLSVNKVIVSTMDGKVSLLQANK
jgi:outer membrane protein assembly factor BamB/calcineurin-like phosphoesterase family protein